MAEDCRTRSERRSGDWAGDWRSLVLLWGLPVGVMLGAWLLADPTPRTGLWGAMLVWMGVACVANARRCGRTHCRFTGPFFLVVAALVAVHGTEVLPLGPSGWAVLGGVTLIGNAVLWWGSERLLGRFVR